MSSPVTSHTHASNDTRRQLRKVLQINGAFYIAFGIITLPTGLFVGWHVILAAAILLTVGGTALVLAKLPLNSSPQQMAVGTWALFVLASLCYATATAYAETEAPGEWLCFCPQILLALPVPLLAWRLETRPVSQRTNFE